MFRELLNKLSTCVIPIILIWLNTFCVSSPQSLKKPQSTKIIHQWEGGWIFKDSCQCTVKQSFKLFSDEIILKLLNMVPFVCVCWRVYTLGAWDCSNFKVTLVLWVTCVWVFCFFNLIDYFSLLKNINKRKKLDWPVHPCTSWGMQKESHRLHTPRSVCCLPWSSLL